MRVWAGAIAGMSQRARAPEMTQRMMAEACGECSAETAKFTRFNLKMHAHLPDR